MRPNVVKYLPRSAYCCGVKARGAPIKPLEGDVSAESFRLSRSVTLTAFLGREQDVRRPVGVREREKARRAQEPQVLVCCSILS